MFYHSFSTSGRRLQETLRNAQHRTVVDLRVSDCRHFVNPYISWMRENIALNIINYIKRSGNFHYNDYIVNILNRISKLKHHQYNLYYSWIWCPYLIVATFNIFLLSIFFFIFMFILWIFTSDARHFFVNTALQ